MADVELLPLPEWQGDSMTESEFEEAATTYARANLAPLQAENERLRAEVERWKSLHATAYDAFRTGVATERRLEARADRLAEALRWYADALERLAFAIPAPNAHTPQLVELAIAMRAAALAQEDRNG